MKLLEPNMAYTEKHDDVSAAKEGTRTSFRRKK